MAMNINNLVRPNIQKMVAYSSARHDFTGEATTFLDANENPFDTGFNRYPDPLQHAVKAKLSKIKSVPAKNIFLGNGSDEAIDLLMRIFCRPQVDHILTLPPTYGMYKVSAAISDIENRMIPLTSDFQPKVEEILNAANAFSKLLFICSPNNPTGNDIELERIEALIQGFKGIVVVDEAYIDFAGQPSCTQFLEKYNNLVVLQTFSKAWGLAGIRLGMAFASEEIIQLFNKVKPPYNVNQLTQEAALKALENEAAQQSWVQTIKMQRAWLAQQLTELNIVKKIHPTNANFILAQFENPKKIYQYLVQQGIIIRDRTNVLLCDDCLRITVGIEEENKFLIESLKNYIKD